MKNQVSPFSIIAILLVLVGFYAISGCGSCMRLRKNIATDIQAGVERVATLYDYNGKVIKRWEGKMDLSNSTIETYLLIGDKRVIIHGGIMVVEEK